MQAKVAPLIVPSLFALCYRYSGPTWLEGIVGKKRPKARTSEHLDELLKKYALRRLERGLANPPKPKKAKPSKKR
jgi:hypothetical protein